VRFLFASYKQNYLHTPKRLIKIRMARTKQLKLFEFDTRTSFGGTLNLGKRKVLRPLDSKRPVHLIFKADQDDLLLRERALIEEVLRRNAAKLGLRIRTLAVNADHIHIVIEFPSREIFKKWIRAVTGVLARKIQGLSWRQLPYTEIVNWGRHLVRAESYVEENQSEANFILRSHRYVGTWRLHVGESMQSFETLGQSQPAVRSRIGRQN
jgi:REP element-mobilizing transposase RayT